VYFKRARIISSVLLGGALSLLVGLLVLGVAALAILAVWLLLGRRDEAPLRNPYTAYLGIVLFVSFLAAFLSVKGLASSVAGAIADQPIDYFCDEGFYDDEEFFEEEESVGGEEGGFGPGEFRENVPPRPFEGAPPGVVEQLPPETEDEAELISTPACPRQGARGRAGAQAAENGTTLIVALAIFVFHARAGRRLLNEETRDA